MNEIFGILTFDDNERIPELLCMYCLRPTLTRMHSSVCFTVMNRLMHSTEDGSPREWYVSNTASQAIGKKP